jgi:lysophospholipase L1-like esterase
MTSVLPLTWANKEDSPNLSDFLSKFGAKYILTASEINQLRDAVNEMAIIQQSVFLGSVEPASTPTGTGRAYWMAITPGTYTNFGGVVVSANSQAFIARDAAGAFTISQRELDLTDYIQSSSMNEIIISPNIYNKVNAIIGKEVYGDGTFVTEDNSAVTGFIPLPPDTNNIYISGLTVYATGVDRYVAFYDVNKAFLAVFNNVDGLSKSITEKGFSVPTNSRYVAFSIYQRKTSGETININSIQVELGGIKSPYSEYELGISSIENKKLFAEISPELLSYSVISTNVYDKSNTIIGKEVYGDGTFSTEVNSAVTGFIPLPPDTDNIYISGLTTYAFGFDRYVAFYDANKDFLAVFSNVDGISKSITEKGFSVPTNSRYVAFSIYQRKTSEETININLIQVEIGTTKNIYSEYEVGISEINKKKIFASNQSRSIPALKTSGLNMLCFGDSITETATVSDDGATYTEGTRSNWTKFTKQALNIGTLWNYAKSGGNWKDISGLEFRQKISNQITAAINNSRPADIIVISCGTNSSNTDLGSYATAMSKSTLSALDRTLTYEAIRWSLWTLRLNYPDAHCFIATPLQRADREPLTDLSNAIKQMGNRYNFIIIDAEYESGIVKDFEVDGSLGRYLYDGLHPNESGQILMANLFSTKILANI